MATYQVIVIGAGAIGASIAAALAEAGLGVALLERGCAGAQGATRYTGGIVRQMDSDPLRARLAAAAPPWPRSGVVRAAFAAALRRCGAAHLALPAACRELLESAGSGVRLDSDLASATGLALAVHPVHPLAALVEADGGISDVHGYVARLAAYVRERAVLHDHLPVASYHAAPQGALVRAGGVQLSAEVVVDAGGARAPQGRPAGLVHARSIPFTRFATPQVPLRPLIAHAAGTYVLPLGPGAIQVGGQIRSRAADLARLDLRPGGNEDDARQRLAMLGFDCAALQSLGTTVAYDAYTDDGRPALGFADSAERLYLATGFCGVGYKMAPAVAELVTADILRRLGGAQPESGQQALLHACSPRRLGGGGMMRIGVCAALQVDSTVHARGFLHGVYLAACTLPGIRRAELLFHDDGASAEGGARAAAAFVAAGVHAVVGHFASASAEAALPHYRGAGLPLLLPASTRAGLTRQGSTAFRICASDRVLARQAAALLRGQGLQRVHLAGDDSLHGRSQLEELHEALRAAGVRPVPGWREAQAGMYCGRLKASIAFLHEQRAAGNALPLYFTDDAAAPELTAHLQAPGEVAVLSFPAGAAVQAAADCQALFGAPPLLYTLETAAAFAVLEQAAQASAAPPSRPALLHTLREREFAGPLGAIRFAAGENLHAQVALWRHSGGALREHAILAPLGLDTSNQ